MRWCLLFVVLFGLAFAGNQAQACAQSNDPCSVAPCPCAGFTVQLIQTNNQNGQTEVIINATNFCSGGVYYVNFGMTDGTTTLTPIVASTFSGQYSWNTNTNYQTSNPTRSWLQFVTPGGGQNNAMKAGTGSSQWELFTFYVTNYNPTFGWYFQMHYGAAWDTYGPIDMSLCQCTNCDAGFSQRTIQQCVLGYANSAGVYSGSTNRAYSVFNENQVLYSYAMYNNLLALFYSDEYPMTLGIQTITNSMTGETRNYPFTNGTQNPVCVLGSNIKFGQTASFDGLDPWAAIDGNGPDNGCNELTPNPVSGKTCGRPMVPLMFISDITTDKNNISGDWQMYGTGRLPSKICGLWQASVKTVTAKNSDGTYAFSVVPVTHNIPPGNQNPVGSGLPAWNLGSGSDAPPIGFVNPSAVGSVPYLNTYGTEVAWDLDQLGLISTHSYRFQFLVHDGDSTKVGGDVGQACLITTEACPAGFSGTDCSQCDTNPLPNNGQWTWFCSETGSNPPYNLLKIPVSKVTQAPYAGNGFIPAGNYTDSDGYIVGCNCVRITHPCPQACCGNGQCLDQNGTCKCANTPAGTNLTTCCLPPPPPPPPPTCAANVSKPGVNCSTCLANSFGLSCSWCANQGVAAYTAAALTNGTCVAPKNCIGTEFTTCVLPPPPPPPPTCVANLTQAKGTNCTTCVSNIFGLTCVWCPNVNSSLWLESSYANGGGNCSTSGSCPGVEVKTCTPTQAPPPPIPPPVTPPTSVPVYVPVCSDMTNSSFGGNQSCDSCVSNVRGIQCAWCPTNVSSQPPNRTLVEGVCTTYSGNCTQLFYSCVAPPPPPPPPPKPTCENITDSNCSSCLTNVFGLTCNWCQSENVTGAEILTKGTCVTNATSCPTTVSLTCTLPPPPPPPLTCENVSALPDINCSSCISNVYGLNCAWCAEPANKSNGTCGEYGSCGAMVELTVCEQPCENGGLFCSGHGACINDTCVCDPQTGTGLGYTGPACNITVYPPPLTCANLTGVKNCSDCFAQSAIIGVQCAWCPNTTDPTKILTDGQCIEDYICGNTSYYSCTPPSVFIPPECADNCSNHGYCVNISTCKQIQAMDQGALVIQSTDENGNPITLIYTCSEDSLNETLANNQTSLCACLNPYTGINCGAVGATINIKLAAGIAAGIIAAIVIAAILGLAMCGGGAAAAASAVAAAPASGVDMNPLYVGNDAAADNPLFG